MAGKNLAAVALLFFGNEFYLYSLVAESACSISKIPVSGLPAAELSNFSYVLLSLDAGESVDESSCEKIHESNLPFIYFSPHFNTVCSDTLKLTSGSGFTKASEWTISDPAFHNSSSVRVFESSNPLLLPYISTQSDYGAPSIVAQKDPSKAYLVLFGGSPKRAFLSFPNYENLTLTPDGRNIFSKTVEWLTFPQAAPPTALAIMGLVKSRSFILAVFVLSLIVVALAFAELRQKNSGRKLRKRVAVFALILFAVPLASQALTHTTSLSLSKTSLSVSDSMRAVCRVEASGGDSTNVVLHLEADFGDGFVDLPTADSYALKASRSAWTDCDVVYDSTYCERSWVITALSAGDVPVRCASNSDETSSTSPSTTLQISEKAKKTQPSVANISATENQTGIPENESQLPNQRGCDTIVFSWF